MNADTRIFHGWDLSKTPARPKVVVKRGNGKRTVMASCHRFKGGDIIAHNGVAFFYVPAGQWRPFFDKAQQEQMTQR